MESDSITDPTTTTDSTSTTSKKLQNYDKFLSNYYNTLDITSGIRNRSKNFIDKSYNQLVSSYELLSEEEKLLVTLPVKEEVTSFEDDDNHYLYERESYKNNNCSFQ